MEYLIFKQKQVMVKVFAISIFLSVFCLPGIVFSQSTSKQTDKNINISISAKIRSSIELVTIRSMSFREVQPEQGELDLNPVQNGGAGLMKATGAPNSTVRITFVRQEQIQNVNTNHTLTFNYLVSINADNEQSTSELVDQDSQTKQLNESGELYIWVGGRVNITNAEPGNYRGGFTIEVEYI